MNFNKFSSLGIPIISLVIIKSRQYASTLITQLAILSFAIIL
jgi:hypothetical protein